MASYVTAGPVNNLNCGALTATFTLALNPTYLSVSGNTATVDFGGAVAAAGQAWVLALTVRFNGYADPTDPSDSYNYNLDVFNPCTEADALTLQSAFITGLGGDYDLFEPQLDRSWTDSDIVSFDTDLIQNDFCGALSVTLAYTSGPQNFWNLDPD